MATKRDIEAGFARCWVRPDSCVPCGTEFVGYNKDDSAALVYLVLPFGFAGAPGILAASRMGPNISAAYTGLPFPNGTARAIYRLKCLLPTECASDLSCEAVVGFSSSYGLVFLPLWRLSGLRHSFYTLLVKHRRTFRDSLIVCFIISVGLLHGVERANTHGVWGAVSDDTSANRPQQVPISSYWIAGQRAVSNVIPVSPEIILSFFFLAIVGGVGMSA